MIIFLCVSIICIFTVHMNRLTSGLFISVNDERFCSEIGLFSYNGNVCYLSVYYSSLCAINYYMLSCSPAWLGQSSPDSFPTTINICMCFCHGGNILSYSSAIFVLPVKPRACPRRRLLSCWCTLPATLHSCQF